MNPYLLNMISLFFISFYKSATLTAGFGLGNAIIMFFWQTFTLVNGETQGINCSKYYGAKNWKQMRLFFFRGLFWNMMITIASAFFYYFIDRLLLMAGFEATMVAAAHSMVVYVIPALFLQTLNELMRNYLMSQQVSKPFIWINLAVFAFFPIGGYYIIWYTQWGIAGFGLFKFIVETINFCGLVWCMKKYGHQESLAREPIREILNCKEFKQYLIDFSKILMGWYASYFGLEINTILCGITKDTVTMACWVSYMNLFAILWTIGAGLSITTRTAAGMAIGENKPYVARKLCWQGFVLSTCYSIVAGILIMCLNGYIADVFTEVPAVYLELKYQIFLMGVLALFIGSGATGATMFRVIQKAGVYSILMVFNQVVISTVLSILALFVWKLRAAGVGYAFLVSWVITYVFTVYFFNKFNWKSLEVKQEPKKIAC